MGTILTRHWSGFRESWAQQNYLAAKGNLTSVSVLIFLTPVFAMLLSYFCLGEMLSFLQ
jgi:drug/metabolite transporter (DMT)-like permease